MKPAVYLSGPMSGHEDFNFPAFNKAANTLRQLGYPVVNPADFGANPKYTWKDCLLRDLPSVGYCDVLVTLDGWRKSKGARLEVHVARELSIPVFSFARFVKLLPEREADLVINEPAQADEHHEEEAA